MRLGADPRAVTALFATLAVATVARAEPPPVKKQTPQERKRQQLLDELGLERVEPSPAPSASPPPAALEPAAPPDGTPAVRGAPPGPSFRHAIHPMLAQACAVCHRAGGPAQASRLVLTGDVAADYASVRPLVTTSAPASSPLLLKSSGQMHGGGAPWPADGDAHARVLAWIAKGARLDGGAIASAAPAGPKETPARPAATHPPVKSAADDVGVPAPDEAPAPNVPAPPLEAPPSTTGAPAPDVHELLMDACAGCHNPRGPAAPTRFLLSGDAAGDDAAARRLVDPAAPARSPLLRKAEGELHGGGVVLGPDDPRRARLEAWVAAVAAPAVAPAPASPLPASVAPTPVAVAVAAPPLLQPAPHATPGLPLAAGFFLDGRFDLNYERQRFNGDPWATGSTAALRSYHHFLFLSRESASDPFGLSIEMLTLQFWEAHARFGGHGRPWRLVVGGGKIVVPFGAEPLTHQSYGGLAGFDQRLLPAIWAVEGAAARFTWERGRFVVTDDAFVVRGYALSRADAVLNLQNDFSSPDDARLGVGNRVGVAWACASAWYSTYLNGLGFGRRLFLQAADVTIARPRGVPVLGHFSAGAGALRADVSGGGPGLDYYHFGSYFQLRYHPTDWLTVQYRQGLKTFDNRRGLIVDDTRLGPDDMSTHNFAVMARVRGFTFTLAYFLLFEKAGEIPDDFARASVAYDF
ncbi:MAG TPA: hypothetical protein VHL80_14195 [Polyangia bacterium]|nr:hypothetical protein [Polyangia bacterium]HVZ75420.1 hypothetical protein [Polyangia bacterium]